MSNYTDNKLVSDENNSWSQVMNLINDSEKVLDIGCSSGNFGEELMRNKHCVVDGIDVDAKDVNLAKQKLRNAHVLNVENDPIDIFDEKYDVILMMDVIEHLVEPVKALKKIATLLKPGGRLVFSVPNMSHISVRLDLLMGKFNYRNTGLLDDTHLHFYTEEYLRRVLSNAGYDLAQTSSTTVTYPIQLVTNKLKDVGLVPLSSFRDSNEKTNGNIYQFIGVAVVSKAKKSNIPFPKSNIHEEHYKQIEKHIDDKEEIIQQLNKLINQKDDHIRHIETELSSIKKSYVYKLANKPLSIAKKIKHKIK